MQAGYKNYTDVKRGRKLGEGWWKMMGRSELSRHPRLIADGLPNIIGQRPKGFAVFYPWGPGSRQIDLKFG
jgi:hypothetical protein